MKAFMYSAETPQGKIFEEEELDGLGDEWVDSPAKLGDDIEVATDTVAADPMDKLDAYLAGNFGDWSKPTFIEVANLLGADMGADARTGVKKIKVGIEATIEAVQAFGNVTRDEIDRALIADYLAATE